MDNLKIPKIRFQGYTDTWEQREVSSMFKVTRGNVLSTTETDSNRSDEKPYPVYSSQTKDNGLMGYYQQYLFENAITWTTDGANAGTVRYRSGKFYCTNVCGVLLADNIEPNQMVSEAINNVAKQYVSYVGNPKLMNNVMSDINIRIPRNSEERDLMSKLFLTLDNLITCHQRKHDALINIKKSLLAKMFPNSDEMFPKIRFQGFKDAWEQRELGEVATEIVAGGDVDKDRISDFGKYPVIANALTNDGIVGYYSDKFRIKAPAVTVTGRGDIGHAKARTIDFTPVVRLITILSKLDAHFLENRINTLNIMVESTGVPQLTVPQLSKYNISYPISKKEQNQIGTLFKTLDNLITCHQRELDKLKTIKKSLLDKMFV